MNDFPILTASLLDLLYELRGTPVRLIVCGGFGLYLKQQLRRTDELRTLLIPIAEARSTQDLDIFLKTEILAYPEMLIPFRGALERLGYSVVPGAEYYHFARPIQLPSGEGRVKIDLLTGLPNQSVPEECIRVDERRVKPSIKNSRIHGRLMPEAFSLEDHATEVPISGQRTTGENYGSSIYLPHTFHYLVMKLTAYRDAEKRSHDLFQPDSEREFARRNAVKHAFDLYTILASTNEDDWDEARQLSDDYHLEPAVLEAAIIVENDFSHPNGMGLLRLRESAYADDGMELDQFQELLHDVFSLDEDPLGFCKTDQLLSSEEDVS